MSREWVPVKSGRSLVNVTHSQTRLLELPVYYNDRLHSATVQALYADVLSTIHIHMNVHNVCM